MELPPMIDCIRIVFVASVLFFLFLGLIYLSILNWAMCGTPAHVKKITQKHWTKAQVKERYEAIKEKPMTISSITHKLPPQLQRRYIITGGSGLVGGYLVLLLIARGQPPESIRIVDFQKPHRNDMVVGPAAEVDFVKTDISSKTAVAEAFARPWHPSVKHLPLTVFHTAAVIVPSDRSELVYGLCQKVNIHGTRILVEEAQAAGADVFIATSSGSVSIRPVEFWISPWELLTKGPRYHAQVLDESDFWKPLRPHHEYFGNYPASKAFAERIVCGANSDKMRTGCIRPANGIYGNPTDNIIGSPLAMGLFPSWTPQIAQSYIHAINCAVAHLNMEAALDPVDSASRPQAGRPFTVTDPNPPITNRTLWSMISTLSITMFRTVRILCPVLILMVAHAIEWYALLPYRYPRFKRIIPPLNNDIKHLKPPLFTITTHLIANHQGDATKPVSEGGIGYTGLTTSMDGMIQEVLEWNQEHEGVSRRNRRKYISSVTLAEEIRKLGEAAMAVGG
ncbi:hypothetical protein PgNI_10979 [Pyricularia grisea]|uniref:3-beta hydroxysteroid dehydrogenase/isomerase domain-containing protein n=1 Tax=Pyricularia grisea TaxID=148305 RepID=A0A6P8AZ38_PYRGI|nr:hypothetical protein PgNI_10979 [Pyricularia grisea]TLD07559.1 hypothetical protein PgNI_10979 [Pyricularia grisea]